MNTQEMNTREITKKEIDSALEQQLKGNWKQFSGRIKESWGVLTQDDMDRAEGRIDQLVGLIQERTGEARETVAKKLRELAKSVKS